MTDRAGQPDATKQADAGEHAAGARRNDGTSPDGASDAGGNGQGGAGSPRGPFVDRRAAAQTPSLDELIYAFRTPGRPHYDECRRAYQAEHGQIRDNYYAKYIHAGAIILKPRGIAARLMQKRKINLRYDGLTAAAVQPEFEAAIWRARRLERESALILGGRSRKVLVEMIFMILVYLLSVLDAVSKTRESEEARARETKRRVEAALRTAQRELDRLQVFTRDASKKASLRWYLFGLPAGAFAGFLLLAVADAWSSVLVGAPSTMVKVCFAAGAVGAIVSVMTRISHGKPMVDSQQGHFVTLLAGGFRPLIGGVFGLALYVFVQGSLVPLETPEGQASEQLFFAAIAFLSGFSERWAQDTIVQSAPLSAMRAQGETTPEDDLFEDEPDERRTTAGSPNPAAKEVVPGGGDKPPRR